MLVPHDVRTSRATCRARQPVIVDGVASHQTPTVRGTASRHPLTVRGVAVAVRGVAAARQREEPFLSSQASRAMLQSQRQWREVQAEQASHLRFFQLLF